MEIRSFNIWHVITFCELKKIILKKSTIITNVKRLNKNQIKPDVDFVFKKPISSFIQYYK